MKRWLAPVLYAAVTTALFFPILRHIGSVVPHDAGDPVLNAWLLWWSSKRLPLTAAWWNAPMFYPAADVMALSELLIGLLPITLTVQWLTHNPVAAYNVALILSFPLSGLAARALARDLTGRDDAALLAGLVYAFAPYRMGELEHIQVLSYYFAPLTLLGLHRYLRTGRARWLAVFGATWLMQSLANGYALFHLSLFVALWIAWFVRRGRSLGAILAAWAAAALPLIPELLKYRQVHQALHLTRDINEIKRLSLGALAILSGSSDLVVWGRWLNPGNSENKAFPGATVLVVGLAWLVTARPWRSASSEPRTRDEWLLIAAASIATAVAASVLLVGPWTLGPLTVGEFRKPFSLAVLFRVLAFVRGRWMRTAWRERSVAGFYVLAMAAVYLLALGPEPRLMGRPILYEAPYAWLMRLPGFETLRVPARFAMLMVLCQSVLVACAVRRWAPRWTRSRAMVALLAAGIVADGLTRVPAAGLPAPGPAWPDAVAAVVQLPAGEGDFSAIYRSLQHGRPIVNGYSGYLPPHYLPFVFAMRDGQFSALLEIARGQLLGIGVERSAPGAAAIEQTLNRMAGVSRFTQDERWSTFMMHARAPRVAALGPELALKSVSANRHGEDTGRMMDGRVETAWSGGPNQIGDEEVIVDLGSEQSIGGIELDLGPYSFGFPRSLLIDVGSNQSDWRPAWAGQPASATVRAAVQEPATVPLTIDVGAMAGRFVRLQQVGSEPGIPWWIAEIRVRAPAAPSGAAASP